MLERSARVPCSPALRHPPISDAVRSLDPLAGLEHQERLEGGRRGEQGGGAVARRRGCRVPVAALASAQALAWQLTGGSVGGAAGCPARASRWSAAAVLRGCCVGRGGARDAIFSRRRDRVACCLCGMIVGLAEPSRPEWRPVRGQSSGQGW